MKLLSEDFDHLLSDHVSVRLEQTRHDHPLASLVISEFEQCIKKNRNETFDWLDIPPDIVG